MYALYFPALMLMWQAEFTCPLFPCPHISADRPSLYPAFTYKLFPLVLRIIIFRTHLHGIARTSIKVKPRKTETHLKRQWQSVNKSDSSIQTGVKGPRGVYFDRIKHRDACTAGYEKTNSFTGVSSSFQRTNSQSIWKQKLATHGRRQKLQTMPYARVELLI